MDMGGEIDFLLNQLVSHKIGVDITLVNEANSISSECSWIGEFKRSAIMVEQKRFFFLMRSVLLYLGEYGVMPLLRHLHEQSREGEFFLHQSV